MTAAVLDRLQIMASLLTATAWSAVALQAVISSLQTPPLAL